MAKIKTIAAGHTHADGMCIGDAATSKLAFNGSTPVTQPAHADQAAVSTAALNVGAAFNQAEVTAIATRATALTVLTNRLRAELVTLGLIKGAA